MLYDNILITVVLKFFIFFTSQAEKFCKIFCTTFFLFICFIYHIARNHKDLWRNVFCKIICKPFCKKYFVKYFATSFEKYTVKNFAK